MMIYAILIGVMGCADMVGYISSELIGKDAGEMIFGQACEGRKMLHGPQRSVNTYRVRNVCVVATLGSANLATFSMGMKVLMKLCSLIP